MLWRPLIVVDHRRRLVELALRAEPFALRSHNNADALEVEPLDPAVLAIAGNHFGHLIVGRATIAIHRFTLPRGTPAGRNAHLARTKQVRLYGGKCTDWRNLRPIVDYRGLEGGRGRWWYNRCG